MLNSIKKILIVSQYTFTEIYKSKIMVNVILLGLSMAVVSYVAAEFTYGVPGKVSLDFGLGALSLSCVGIAIFMGSNLISKEVESRTIYMALSRPISRTVFLSGRILGMVFFLAINTLLLSLVAISFYLLYGGQVQGLILWAILFSFIESVIILLVVVNFSMLTNSIMSVVYSICLYATGHALPQTLELGIVERRPGLQTFIEVYSTIFPNFDRLSVKDFVLFEQFLPQKYLAHSLLYGMCYSLFLFVIAVALFRRKSLD